MHLILPFAGPLSDAGREAARSLRVPRLEALLSRLSLVARDEGDELSLTPPHERVLGRELGLHGRDGCLPWAALHAQGDGLDTRGLAWGELTPVHCEVGADQVSLFDPQALGLDEVASRTLFDALRPLFEEDGFHLAYGAPTRWYAAHDSFAELPAASLDRVVGRNVDRWLPEGGASRTMQRLQSEVQMLLHSHPINEVRAAEGALPVNSVWLSGCGRAQAARQADLRVDDRLRAPSLAEDWPAWLDAWRALDDGPLARPDNGLTLTLCGERSAARFEARPRGLLQRLRARWRPAGVPALLESL
jgi:hypothetical protein